MNSEQQIRQVLLSLGFDRTRCPVWATKHSHCFRCPCNRSHLRVNSLEERDYLENTRGYGDTPFCMANQCERRASVVRAAIKLQESISEPMCTAE